MGITESPFFDRAGSEGCIKGWSPRMLQAWHHKPIDSTRVETGQPSFRGRVRCQSHLVAWERRRREPGSNSVSDTASLTRCEGQVLRLGGVRRVRKIFAGCPAIRPIWDQSPRRKTPRSETVGNRLNPSHGQNSLCRFAAEAQIQDRSRDKTGPNTAPAFLRAPRHSPALPRHSRGGGNPEKNKARRLSRGACPVPRYGGGNPEKNKARRLTLDGCFAQLTSFPRRRESSGVGQTGTSRLFGLVTAPISSCAKHPRRGEGILQTTGCGVISIALLLS